MTDEIRWEKPPGTRRAGDRDWHAVAEALRARPGEWAMVGVYANSSLAASTARHLKTGKYAGLPSGFEAMARTVDGEFRVYARYVGEATS